MPRPLTSTERRARYPIGYIRPGSTMAVASVSRDGHKLVFRCARCQRKKKSVFRVLYASYPKCACVRGRLNKATTEGERRARYPVGFTTTTSTMVVKSIGPDARAFTLQCSVCGHRRTYPLNTLSSCFPRCNCARGYRPRSNYSAQEKRRKFPVGYAPSTSTLVVEWSSRDGQALRTRCSVCHRVTKRAFSAMLAEYPRCFCARGRKYKLGRERLTLQQLSLRCRIPHDVLRVRIARLGWSVAEAIATPATGPTGRRVDLTGQRFGLRVVTGRGSRDQWKWKCDCGAVGSQVAQGLRGTHAHRGCRLRPGALALTEQVLCTKHHVSPAMFRRRVSAGWSRKRAASTPPSALAYDLIRAKAIALGKAGGTPRRIAPIVGASPEAVRSWLRRIGITPLKRWEPPARPVGKVLGNRRVLARTTRGWSWACLRCRKTGHVDRLSTLAKASHRCQGLAAIRTDRTGERYGRRVVTALGSVTPRRWRWRCDCGAVGVSAIGVLRVKGRTHPGCRFLSHTTDLTGRVFGFRKILGLVRHHDGKRRWRWRCQCGGTGVDDTKTFVIRGKPTSTSHAGCLLLSQTTKATRFAIAGQSLTFKELEALFGATRSMIEGRLKRGVPIEEAIFAPKRTWTTLRAARPRT